MVLKSFDELKGHTLTECKVHDEMVMFTLGDGSKYILYHDQDCCESVAIEDVVGSTDDLVGSPILSAEESSSSDNLKEHDESATWTFYRIGTAKGSVVIRWYGSSNGYYSERVDFCLDKRRRR